MCKELIDNAPEHLATHANFIPAHYHFERHAHDYHELFLVQSGKYRIKTSNVERIVEPGDVVLYPAGVLHEEWVEDDAPLLDWACEFRWNDLEWTDLVVCHDANGRVQEIIARLAWEYIFLPEEQSPQGRLPLLQMILSEVKHLVAPEHQQVVDKVKAHIAAHLDQPLNLEDLAAISGLSTSYFARQYRATIGRTPMEDLRLMRLEEARRLLVKTSLPLYEIAIQIGIPDVYYLSRLLKEHFGISARKLRELGQESA